MENTGLARDWVSRPALDIELKQYLLLGYLQRVNARFAEHKLYPWLDELGVHLRELQLLRSNKEALLRNLSGDLVGFDATNGQAVHERPIHDPWLGVIDTVVELAMPLMRDALTHGTELREELATQIRFAPVGLVPLVAREGWLLLRTGREARAYTYNVPLLRGPDPLAGTLHVRTHYVSSFTMGIARTFEHIKMHLIDNHRELPNPAVFAFESDLALPHIETFMPLAKQLVYETVSGRA